MKAAYKIISSIVALIIILSVPFNAFAAEKVEEIEKVPYVFDDGINIDTETPVIYVPGIFNTNLVDSTGRSLMFPTFTGDDILNLVKELAKLEDTQDYDGFVDSLIAQIHAWADGLQYNDEGEPIDKSVKLSESWDHPTASHEPMAQSLAAELGNDKVWVFTYDWRKDIRDIVVNELRPFVEYVKQYSGSDKVSLFFMSMGCTVGNVYLAEYGDKGDLKNIVMDSGALGGVSIIADVLGDQPLHIDRQSMVEFIESAEDGLVDEIGTVSGIASSISEYVFDKLNICLERRSDELIAAVMDIIGKHPGVWELGKHEAMMKYIDKYLDSVKNKTIIDKITYYYENYQDKAGEICKGVNDNGYANLRVIAHYNCKRVPVTPNTVTLQSDFLIDTEYESLGATVLDLYETFPENYKVANGDNQAYLSPDYMVDASTCADPDHTWFVKNAVHCCMTETGSPMNKYYIWLALAEGDIDINTLPEYPQYIMALSGFRIMPLEEYLSLAKIDESAEAADEAKSYCSSAITTYSYIVLGPLSYACIFAAVAIIIWAIIKKSKNKAVVEGVLSKKEIKALPKNERKAAKKNNKQLKTAYSKNKKAEAKAYKAELKAMPKAERKAAVKAEKAQKKAAKKETKAAAKVNKKAAKAEKKANKK